MEFGVGLVRFQPLHMGWILNMCFALILFSGLCAFCIWNIIHFRMMSCTLVLVNNIELGSAVIVGGHVADIEYS